MFGRSILITVHAALLLFACAEAKYVRESGLNPDGPAIEAEKLNCSHSFVKLGLCLHWYWEKRPTSTTDVGSLIFKTYRMNVLDQTPIEIDAASVPDLVLWMPKMGHGSAPTKTSRIDVGTYRASNINLFMPGEWELKFQINSGIDTDEIKIDITF